MNTYRQKLGRWGEEAAAEFLQRQGCSIRGKNIRTPHGEIDLVVEFTGEVHFVEVKTRTNTRYGNPEEAISREKYQHMSAAAEWYMSQNPDSGNVWHLDVVAIIGSPPSDELNFEWFRDVEVG